ncbi:MAG: chorismate mutase [Anaerolineaceae bacterium]
MSLRGIRGATTVEEDQEESVLDAAEELLNAIQQANPTLDTVDLASAIFSVTEDLRSVHPAKAARRMGWNQVPLICAQEIPVPGSLPKCIRVLLHWNTLLSQEQIQHVYLREAVSLRPDLIKPPVDR